MEKICEHCGKRFNARYDAAQYCSIACARFRFKIKKDKQENDNAHENEQPEDTASPLSQLRVIKGDLFNTVKRVKRTQDLLNFSHSVLWPDKNFSEDQQLKLKLLIAEHFRGSKDIDQTFRELVERTCLAKRWLEEKDYRIIPEPQEWFNINCLEGLYFTHSLYSKVLNQRRTIPSYQYGLTVISEAVLRYCEKRNVLDIHSYREQFIKLLRLDLLHIYFNAIMHIQFINL